MKLISQIIQKKLDLYNEFMIKRFYSRAIWQFYSAYNICVSIVDFQEDEKITKKRQKLWVKLFLNPKNEKSRMELMMFIKKDQKVINMAFNLFEELSESKEEGLGDIDRPLAIGVSSYDFPE